MEIKTNVTITLPFMKGNISENKAKNVCAR